MRIQRTPVVVAAATTMMSQAFPPFIGTPAWFDWLETVVLVTLITTRPAGIFVLRHERSGSTGAWYVYVDSHDPGHARRVKVGPTAHLTRLHLANILAATLPATPATITILERPTHTGMSPLFPLLMTKLQVPQSRRVTLVVPAREQIGAALTVPLTLVSAPAGAGKTTLVARWLTATSHAAGWVTLDAADGELARFWTYVLATLEPVLPGVLQDLQPLVHDPPATWMPVLLNRCLEITAPLVLVLDEAQRLPAAPPAVIESLAFFVDHLPHHLHLVVLCRQAPPLPFARWRAQGRLLELPATALRVSTAEVQRLLADNDLDLATTEVRQLDETIAGWISGWHLVADALRRCSDRAQWIATFTGTRTITEYFQEEVLAGLATTTVTFLLHTAILEQLTVPVCNALMETSGSQAQLAELEHAHCFLDMVDEHRQVYRYHPLFAQFLRQRLQQLQPALIPVLTLRASAWYASQGDHRKAVAYAAQSGDPVAFAQTLEATSSSFLRHGQLATLHRWLMQVPEVVLTQHPHLGVLAAYCGQGQRHPVPPPRLPSHSSAAAAEHHLLMGELRAYHALRLAMQENPDHSDIVYQQVCTHLPPNHPLLPVLRLDLGRVALHHGELQRAHALVTAVRQPSRAALPPYFAAASARYLAQIAFVQGDLATVLRECRGANAEACADDTVVLYALALYERNELEHALQVVRPCLTDTASSRTVALALGLMALIQAARGETVRAHQLLAQALARAASTGAATRAISMFVALRLHLLTGATTTALAMWDQHQGKFTSTSTVLQRYLPILQARLALLRGEPHAALASLAPIMDTLRAAGYQRYVLDALIIQAQAHQALDQPDAACQLVCQALEMAAPEGWMRPFLDGGFPLQQLMAAAGARLPPFGHAVLRAFPTPMSGAPQHAVSVPAAPRTAVAPLIDPLTRRERDIVRHLLQGDSNGQVAQALGISLGTAKRHVSNIFLKLGVKNRSQALLCVLALHLLDEKDRAEQLPREAARGARS